jgi:hypothetical protein
VVITSRRSAAARSLIDSSKRATMTVPIPYVAPSASAAPEVVDSSTEVWSLGVNVEKVDVWAAGMPPAPRLRTVIV